MKTNRIVNIIKVSAFALFTGVISTSCLDQLEEETYGKYSADTYFDTTGKMEMAVNGIYETFSSITTYGQYWQVYGDCDTDIAHVKGAGTGHVARDLGHYNAYAEHSWLQSSWELYYQGIDRANTILDQKDNVVIRDIPKITKFKATNSLRVSCLFCIFKHSPKKNGLTAKTGVIKNKNTW